MPAKGIGYMPVRIVCRLEGIRFRFYRRENPLGILADIFVSLAGDDEDFAGLFSWLRIQISYICILIIYFDVPIGTGSKPTDISTFLRTPLRGVVGVGRIEKGREVVTDRRNRQESGRGTGMNSCLSKLNDDGYGKYDDMGFCLAPGAGCDIRNDNRSGPGVPGERGGFQNPFSRFAGECAHDDRFAVRLFGDFDA